MFESIIGQSYVPAVFLLLFGATCVLAWLHLDQVDQPIIKNLPVIPNSKPLIGTSRSYAAHLTHAHRAQVIYLY